MTAPTRRLRSFSVKMAMPARARMGPSADDNTEAASSRPAEAAVNMRVIVHFMHEMRRCRRISGSHFRVGLVISRTCPYAERILGDEVLI